jgi:hypothetical protein
MYKLTARNQTQAVFIKHKVQAPVNYKYVFKFR